MPEGRREIASATGPGTPVLASRLSPPTLPEPVVLRPRLLRALDAGTAAPVTLVAAPAGWGKTTLLASWFRAAGVAGRDPVRGGPVTGAADGARDRDTSPGSVPPGDFGAAGPGPGPGRVDLGWVSVECGDDGDRLWSYLVAALRAVEDPGGGPPLPDRPPRPDQLELLAAALAARERPVLLVLDDLHRVADPAAVTGLEFLLRHAEQRFRLVAGTRAGVPLAVHRWRLAGELTEVGPDQLAFTADETADLLTAHGVALPAGGVRRLRERTGGWPAPLRFAALALHGQPDPDRWVEQFGGDQPDVADYLRGEVLAGLDPDDREVLRRAAVADAVCAGLADALTGRGDAEAALATLSGEGGPLLRGDGRPPWYRCHPLLADLLHTELGRLPPDDLRELHLRAAGWYADNGRPADGLRHALAGADWARATELFVMSWPELAPYDPVGPDGPAPAAASPPAEAMAGDPELALACAAERAHAGDVPAATGYLRRAAQLARSLPVPRRERFVRLATAVELAVARRSADSRAVRDAATRLLASRPAAVPPGPEPVDRLLAAPAPQPEPRGAGAEDADVRAVAGTALGLADLADGDLRSAETHLGVALAAARTTGRTRTELVGASRVAVLSAVRGGLREAEASARAALALPPCQGWSCRTDRGYAYLALAVVALYRDQPEETEANLALAEPASGEPDGGAVAGLCRAHLLRDAGDLAGGQRALAAARDRLAERSEAGEPERWLRVAEADLRGARGDLEAARDLLADAGDDAVLAVGLARVELRAGDVRAAEAALPDWQAVEADGWPLPVRLEAAVLDAVLAGRAGDERRARRVLERALDLAGPEGVRRPFAHADPGLRDLLAAHLDTGTAHWPTVDDLVRGADEPAERVGTGAGPAVLDEPLTERELTILRYLQSLLSNVEIAAELSLSVNTVKTHVRNIYRKLDATRRREAVRRARDLRLI
ncbi:LuxR C-terminal-related transcriptional regulator [Micromonospora sp. WMMA1363]|uniref:LuxR C-terminal-related transcriptional regulator n=1 Tax=Micromonospora sp. WMMA1363 TaxID=3053985 RepID=UPI00259CA0CD|nr:LuxR C-terminal-related transcriptional regulator [Micromonospora sp. WMMA1363]MDM4720212.1 LuxR C-terminal-related transcriptional regulator [Micromonospora sp. WMMA1363]